MDFLSQLVKMIQGGDTYISQRPENLGVRYKKYGPLSIIDGPATHESKKAALANRKAGYEPQMTPAQRDFPGRTNYGVPEDNMIDTPQGYVTAEQYNQMMAPKPFKMYEDQSFQGDPRQFMMANPSYRFYEDNSFSPPQALQDASNSLSVRPPVDSRQLQVAPSNGIQSTGSGSLLNQLSVRRPRR